MPRGPLPTENPLRRNAPTIPTTQLPAGGRKGPTPTPPRDAGLGAAGKRWWKWAWATPQAAGWDDGSLYVVARRARLEDDLAAIDLVDEFSVADFINVDEEDRKVLRRLDDVLHRMKSLAGGRMTLAREARELEDRLGLTPKGLAQLRWKIVADEAPAKTSTAGRGSAYGHLAVVGGEGVGGV